jgi:hypothetical protein
MIIDKKEIETLENACLYFFKGNVQAVNLVVMYFEACHLFDDLIDKDKVNEDAEILRVFRYLIFSIPTNPVYRAIPSLPDHMMNIYLRWIDSTNMEKMENPDIEKTYMLRAGLYDLMSIIACYLYGAEWAEEIGPQIRSLYGETIESLRGEICQIQ